MEWFTDYHMLHVHPMPSDSENGPMFTALYYLLKRNRDGELTQEDRDKIKYMIEQIIQDNGQFRTTPYAPTDHWSHDNHTGLVVLSYLAGLDYHKSIPPDWYKRGHPRDLVFYLYMKGGIWSFLAWFFLWIPSIAMIVSCIQSYKVRGGNKIVKTDGKLLTWMRVNCMKMPITARICDFFIKQNSYFGSWKRCFGIYFGHRSHPNNCFPDECYEV